MVSFIQLPTINWPPSKYQEFCQLLGNKLPFLVSMNSTIVEGNRQKTSGNFSDSQKSGKFYLEYNALLQPIHFLDVELSSSQPKNTGWGGQEPGSSTVLCNYWIKLGKFLSSLLVPSPSERVNVSPYLTWVAEFKLLLACSSPNILCSSNKCHQINAIK